MTRSNPGVADTVLTSPYACGKSNLFSSWKFRERFRASFGPGCCAPDPTRGCYFSCVAACLCERKSCANHESIEHVLAVKQGGPLSYPPRPRFAQTREPLHRRNGKIRAREVRVLDETKQQLGVMSLNDALRLAQAKGLDLVEVAAAAVPPVCRIVNYGKLLYEEAKRKKENQARSPASRMKELQISPSIDPHDLGVKRGHAIQFLCQDLKVRIKLRFKGRQKAHKEVGFAVMNKLVKDVAAFGHADAPPKMLGDRDLNVVLTPLPRSKRAKNPYESPAPDSSAEPPAPEPEDE